MGFALHLDGRFALGCNKDTICGRRRVNSRGEFLFVPVRQIRASQLKSSSSFDCTNDTLWTGEFSLTFLFILPNGCLV